MSGNFFDGYEPPTSMDGDCSWSDGSHSFRLPMLNWVNAGLIFAVALTFIVVPSDPATEHEESPAWSIRTRHPEGSIYAVAFSRDGRMLVTGGENGALVLWEIGKSLKKDLSGERLASVFSLAFSRDGSILAAGHGDSTVSIWDVAAGEKRATLTGHSGEVKCLAFSPDGRTLASGDDGPCVRIWDIASGKTRSILMGHRGSICAVRFTPDGLRLASACAGGVLKLWDLTRGESRELMGPRPPSLPIPALSFSPDGSMLASVSIPDGLSVWDVVTGRHVTTIPRECSAAREVEFSGDGRALIEVRDSGVVVCRDLATGQEKSTLLGKSSDLHCSSVSSDTRFVAMVDLDGSLKVWNIATATNQGREEE